MPSALTITISGQPFTLTPPYEAGHQITEIEASVLNQAWIDNIRRNFAKEVPEGELEPSVLETIQQKFEAYVASYEFKTSGPRSATDPIQREAVRIAKMKVQEFLNKKGQKVSDLTDDTYNGMVEKVAGLEAVQNEAKRRVENLRNVAEDVLDVGGL